MNNLLPQNATALERNLATAGAAIAEIPVPIRDLVNPNTCPVSVLPFLAWDLSVDRWDPNWSVATKRAAIKASYFVHKQKGTIGAIRRVVEPLGFLIRVVEWWETAPAGPRGTFALEVGVLETGITEEMYGELERLIDDAKPVSRHMTGLAISLESRIQEYIGVAAYLGDELTVYPYAPGPIEVSARYGTSAAEHTVDTMTIQPFTA